MKCLEATLEAEVADVGFLRLLDAQLPTRAITSSVGNVTMLLSCIMLGFMASLVVLSFLNKSTVRIAKEGDYSIAQAAPIATCWILTGAVLVFVNKYIFMSEEYGGFGFPYPASLCAIQMFVNTVFTRMLAVAKPEMLPAVTSGSLTWDAYKRSVLPMAVTMVFALVLSNAAYLYLSVSYIQMLKAAGPVAVYTTSIAMGSDTMNTQVMMVLGSVAIGVGMTSSGERLFSAFGFLLQIGAFGCDAVKVVLTKLMVSSQDCKLDPLSALYYFAPVSCFGLGLVATIIDPIGSVFSQAHKIFPVLIIDAAIALALQIVTFFLMQCAQASTYSLCSVVRDVGLVYIAAVVFKTPLAAIQIVGYGVAVCGILLFTFHKEDAHCISRALGYVKAQEVEPLACV